MLNLGPHQCPAKRRQSRASFIPFGSNWAYQQMPFSGLPPDRAAAAVAVLTLMRRCISLGAWANIWRIDQGRDAPCIPATLLSNDELATACGYRFRADRDAFVLRRTALRALIGRHLGCRPDAVRFSYNAHGKPSLAWPDIGTNFSFSVARTAGVTLLALAECKAVGVDVERVRYDIDFLNVGRVVFADCELMWLMAGDRAAMADRFFRLWTRKEAYLKAIGCGFMLDPKLFTPTAICNLVENGESRANPISGLRSGQLFELRLGRSLRAAFAIG
jgi:4'-phosphopantetheinyl transferase